MLFCNCKRIFWNILPTNKSAEKGRGTFYQKILKLASNKFLIYHIYSILYLKLGLTEYITDWVGHGPRVDVLLFGDAGDVVWLKRINERPGEVILRPQKNLFCPDEDMECRQAQILNAVATQKAEDVIDPSKFSSWRKLIRVTASIRRLAEKIRLRKHAQEGRNGPLTPQELERAEIFWIKEAQRNLHRKEKGEFKSLSPFLDIKGVIRVGGRVDEAIVSYDTRHPTLPPNDHWISWLITRHAHQYGHNSVAATTAKIRRKYWIISEIKQTKQSSKVQVRILS